MDLPAGLTRLLAALGGGPPRSWRQLERACEDTHYTGAVTLHWWNGKVRQVDLGSPVRLAIVEAGDGAGQRIADPGGLDKAKTPGTG